jgi:hypothetical protein
VLEVLGYRARAHVKVAGDGQVGPAARCELQDLYLTVGQVGQTSGPSLERGPRAVPITRPPQRVAQWHAERGQQVAVVLRKVLACPVQRDRRKPAVRRASQVDCNLVLDRNMPKEF